MAAVLLSATAFNGSSDQRPEIVLFEQAHDLSKQLNAFGHAYALLTLLKNSRPVIANGISNEEYKQWCKEMFQFARQIDDGWNRVAQEKNAALYMSYADPVGSIEYFKQIENPQPMPDGSFPEDVRADAASTIFINLLSKDPQSASALALIESEADRVGQSGEYPYVAMGKVIDRLAESPTDQSRQTIETIFSQALRFYDGRPYKFVNRNRQFYQFLKNTANSVASADLLSKAATLFVTKLLQSPKDLEYQSEIETPKGITHFDDDRMELLFEAFPTIRKLAPALAEQLSSVHPELNKADENMTLRSAGYNPVGIEPSQSQWMHDRTLQMTLVNEISGLNDRQLPQARLLAQRLTDVDMKIQGYSALLRLIHDPNEAHQIYYSWRTRLQEVAHRDDQLRSLVALSKASYYIQDAGSFDELAATALDQGSIIFEQDSRVRPEFPPSGRHAYSDLTEVVTFGTSHDLRSLPAQIQKIESVELKTNLLSIEGGTIVSKSNRYQ